VAGFYQLMALLSQAQVSSLNYEKISSLSH